MMRVALREPDAEVLLETRGFSMHAAGRVLVESLDWQVARGERWCVIGRNGAGKSLLLRALAGLAVPGRDGEILWQGRPQSRWPASDAAALRAFMPQQSQDRFGLTTTRVLALSHRQGADESGADASLADLFEALDIGALAERRVDQLSGGERQRVALAQCSVQGASLVLLDEPVSFQDPAHQQRVGRWLADAGPWRSQDGVEKRTGVRAEAYAIAAETSSPTAASAALARPPSRKDASVVQAGAPPRMGAWIASAHNPSWIARVATHVLALWGDGQWRAGPVAEVLTAEVLALTYGCPWRAVEGAWLPD